MRFGKRHIILYPLIIAFIISLMPVGSSAVAASGESDAALDALIAQYQGISESLEIDRNYSVFLQTTVDYARPAADIVIEAS